MKIDALFCINPGPRNALRAVLPTVVPELSEQTAVQPAGCEKTEVSNHLCPGPPPSFVNFPVRLAVCVHPGVLRLLLAVTLNGVPVTTETTPDSFQPPMV